MSMTMMPTNPLLSPTPVVAETESEINLSIQNREKSLKENQKSTAISLLRRGVMLDDACWHLQCSYNYQIVGKPTPEQIAARTKIGEVATTVLDPIADDLILAGIRMYLEYLGHSHTAVSYTHLRAHETPEHLVCRLLLEK